MYSLISLLYLNLALAYSLCDQNNYPFKGQTVVIPIVPTATQIITWNKQPIPVKVSGNITVLDGCHFQATNFQMAAVLSAVWYGGNVGSSDGIKLSNVTADPHVGPFNYTFPFITDAGSFVSYNDFNQFRLFEVTTQSLIATADLPIPKSSVVSPDVSNTTKSQDVAPKYLMFPGILFACLLF